MHRNETVESLKGWPIGRRRGYQINVTVEIQAKLLTGVTGFKKNQDGCDVYHVYLFKENLRYTQNEKKNPTDGNEKPSIVCSRPIMVELSFLHF